MNTSFSINDAQFAVILAGTCNSAGIDITLPGGATVLLWGSPAKMAALRDDISAAIAEPAVTGQGDTQIFGPAGAPPEPPDAPKEDAANEPR